MKFIPQKVVHLAMLSILLFILFSCSKDTDLLLDSVLNDPEVSVEEKNANNEVPAEEEGFVIRTYTFSATDDAYIQGEAGHDKSIVRLQEDYRTSYLMFDLSQVNGTITDAVLQFSIDSDEGDGSIAIHKGLNANWSEENLSINNAPGLDNQLASINKAYKVGAPEKVVLDATSLKAEATSFVMVHSTGNDLAFASKEHPDNKGPKLTITYKAPEDSAPIEQQEEEEEEEEDSTQEDDTQEEDTNQDEDQNNNTASTEGAYYVTTSGKSSNNGLSEANAWSIDYAFEKAVAGDVVYIKAGDYGNKELVADNSGTSTNPIKFIGYTNTPGDLVSDKGSTFKYGDNLDANKMPLLRSSQQAKGVGIDIPEKYVEIENFQITGYAKGLIAHSEAHNFKAKNIILTDLGTQSHESVYDGFGIDIRGNNSLLENCFVLNAAAQAITLTDADYSTLRYCSVYADNTSNPTDYYFLLAGGTNNAYVENCHVQRASGLSHNGHGFNIKNDGTYNTFKNCTAVRTSFELTYYGVHHNTIDGGSIIGVDTSSGQWEARMSIIGGAHHNTIKNLLIQDTWAAITWTIFDDRKGNDASTGSDNYYENITVKNTNRILNNGGGNNFSAKAIRNTFKDCNFSDFESVAVNYYGAEDIKFENCHFKDGEKFVTEVAGKYAPYSNFDVSWINCTWENVNFTPPN